MSPFLAGTENPVLFNYSGVNLSMKDTLNKRHLSNEGTVCNPKQSCVQISAMSFIERFHCSGHMPMHELVPPPHSLASPLLSSPSFTRYGHLTSPSPTTDYLLPSLRWTLSSCTRLSRGTNRAGLTTISTDTAEVQSRAQQISLNKRGIVQLCDVMCVQIYLL